MQAVDGFSHSSGERPSLSRCVFTEAFLYGDCSACHCVHTPGHNNTSTRGQRPEAGWHHPPDWPLPGHSPCGWAREVNPAEWLRPPETPSQRLQKKRILEIFFLWTGKTVSPTFFFSFLSPGLAMWLVGFLFPDQGLNLGPKVEPSLTTGHQGIPNQLSTCRVKLSILFGYSKSYYSQ